MVTKYYNWNDTLARDADITMVIGARGIGKTYGIRLQFVRDYIKKGYRFLELVRYKNQLADFTSTYFDKIDMNNEFPEYIFKTTSRHAYIAKKPKDTTIKPTWELIGYFGSLTQAQDMKKWTFANVKRIFLDEAVIDKRIDRYHGYLRNEYSTLASIVDSVARERPGVKSIVPRVILNGNACDLMNPYFVAAGLSEPPKEGYTWYRNKTMLIHYVKDSEYSEAKRKDTVAGRMLIGTVDDSISNDNEFLRYSNDFVEQKSKNAKFHYGIVYLNKKYGIWIDAQQGLYFVTRNIPNNATPIFALTTEDNKVNYIMGKRVESVMKGFIDLYYYGIVRFESPELKGEFSDVLRLFGVR